MKKIEIILIVVICISTLTAEVDLSSRASKFTDNFNLTKTHHDSLLQSTIVFSQEDYDVGDVIDIAIHLELNTSKNTENLKFAITDYKNNKFYVLKKGYFETITQNDIENNRNRIILEDIPLKFLESDPDLVLSNDQPKGIYHIKFKLSRKTIGIIAYGKNYPYVIKCKKSSRCLQNDILNIIR